MLPGRPARHDGREAGHASGGNGFFRMGFQEESEPETARNRGSFHGFPTAYGEIRRVLEIVLNCSFEIHWDRIYIYIHGKIRPMS